MPRFFTGNGTLDIEIDSAADGTVAMATPAGRWSVAQSTPIGRAAVLLTQVDEGDARSALAEVLSIHTASYFHKRDLIARINKESSTAFQFRTKVRLAIIATIDNYGLEIEQVNEILEGLGLDLIKTPFKVTIRETAVRRGDIEVEALNEDEAKEVAYAAWENESSDITWDDWEDQEADPDHYEVEAE